MGGKAGARRKRKRGETWNEEATMWGHQSRHAAGAQGCKGGRRALPSLTLRADGPAIPLPPRCSTRPASRVGAGRKHSPVRCAARRPQRHHRTEGEAHETRHGEPHQAAAPHRRSHAPDRSDPRDLVDGTCRRGTGRTRADTAWHEWGGGRRRRERKRKDQPGPIRRALACRRCTRGHALMRAVHHKAGAGKAAGEALCTSCGRTQKGRKPIKDRQTARGQARISGRGKSGGRP